MNVFFTSIHLVVVLGQGPQKRWTEHSIRLHATVFPHGGGSQEHLMRCRTRRIRFSYPGVQISIDCLTLLVLFSLISLQIPSVLAKAASIPSIIKTLHCIVSSEISHFVLSMDGSDVFLGLPT